MNRKEPCRLTPWAIAGTPAGLFSQRNGYWPRGVLARVDHSDHASAGVTISRPSPGCHQIVLRVCREVPPSFVASARIVTSKVSLLKCTVIFVAPLLGW